MNDTDLYAEHYVSEDRRERYERLRLIWAYTRFAMAWSILIALIIVLVVCASR